MIYRLILLGLFLLTIGCSRNIVKEDLIGTFGSDSSQSLELKVDGTYRNKYSMHDGHSVTEEGTWQLERIEDVPTVSLTGFRSPLPGANASGKGIYLMQVRWRGGKVRLYIDEEMSSYLEKTNG